MVLVINAPGPVNLNRLSVLPRRRMTHHGKKRKTRRGFYPAGRGHLEWVLAERITAVLPAAAPNLLDWESLRLHGGRDEGARFPSCPVAGLS
jgi:RNA 3'-terminal phosphate cyclase